MKQTKKTLATVLKVVISCAFFAVLLSFVRANELMEILSRVDWFYLSVAFLLSPLMLLVSCMKWKVILDCNGKPISFFTLLRIYLIGYFFSNLLPSTVGGDVVRSYYAGKLIDNQAYAAVSIFVERVSGVVFLFVLVVVAPLFSPGLYRNPSIFLPACAGGFLLCATMWLWKVKTPLKVPQKIFSFVFYRLYRFVDHFSWIQARRYVGVFESQCTKIFRRLDRIRDEARFAAETLKNDRGYMLKIVGLTVLFYILTWVNVYVAFRAFGVRPDFSIVCALVPAILFAAHVPVTLLGNLGYFESIFVFYFLLAGIPGVETLAMGLLLRAKMLSMGVVGYLVYLCYKQTSQGEFDAIETFQHEVDK
ncbi:MAG: lysylphosphatidylglycerol synthase transmembrane domain-containing protein [Desulfoprunum sp.]|nr:lysylphosphatidylglycerol synthase transmembrane domain-containing protein [Desulfoprunum sp.]